ncbi:MAG TPA: transcriptional regulator [Massilia sp.]|nr:transcriptional regulator [Massilia sp.]
MNTQLLPTALQAVNKPAFRTKDAIDAGLSRMALTRLVRQGDITRIARGLYAVTNRPSTELDSLVDLAAYSEQSVFCLLTALRFHKLTTQSPFEVWLALPNKARAPKIDYPPVRIVWYSGAALTEGVERHEVAGQAIKVYSIAKTIADCFKYRNKIGVDVGIEALREAWREKRVTMRELYHFGKVCRVEKIMRPYLESLV